MKHIASLILVVGTTSLSMAFGQTTIDEMRTQGDIQGLFEVREAARAFVVAQNARQQTNWAALEPDLRAVVPKCLVPLKTRWKDRSQKTLEPVAVVTCKKPTKAFGSGKPWVLEVPVLIPPPAQRG